MSGAWLLVLVVVATTICVVAGGRDYYQVLVRNATLSQLLGD